MLSSFELLFGQGSANILVEFGTEAFNSREEALTSLSFALNGAITEAMRYK